MTICLVTDRRRRPPVEQAREAAEAGVDIIHVRERDLDARALCTLVEGIVGAVRHSRGSRTRVVVNDRIDVALAAGADGVHLRGDSVPPARARSLAPAGFLVGQSVRSVDQAVDAARWCDYLVAGTVFPTPSKPGMTAFLGLDGLAAIAEAVSVPVLAIGGASVERAGDIAAAGATGVAAIGLFTDPDRPIKQVVNGFNIGGKIFPRP